MKEGKKLTQSFRPTSSLLSYLPDAVSLRTDCDDWNRKIDALSTQPLLISPYSGIASSQTGKEKNVAPLVPLRKKEN